MRQSLLCLIFSTSWAYAQCITAAPSVDDPSIELKAKQEIQSHPNLYSFGDHKFYSISKGGITHGVILGSYHLPSGRSNFIEPMVYSWYLKSTDSVYEIDFSKINQAEVKAHEIRLAIGDNSKLAHFDATHDMIVSKTIGPQSKNLTLFGATQILFGSRCMDMLGRLS